MVVLKWKHGGYDKKTKLLNYIPFVTLFHTTNMDKNDEWFNDEFPYANISGFQDAYIANQGKITPRNIMKHNAKEREKQREKQRQMQREKEYAKERQRQIDTTAFILLSGAMVVWGGVVIYWFWNY